MLIALVANRSTSPFQTRAFWMGGGEESEPTSRVTTAFIPIWTGVPPVGLDRNLGPCRALADAGAAHTPACTQSGYFHLIQCSETECWCADVTTGSELEATRESRGVGPPACPVCHRAKASLYNETAPLVGAFVPQCHPTGFFELLQCHGSTGSCWSLSL